MKGFLNDSHCLAVKVKIFYLLNFVHKYNQGAQTVLLEHTPSKHPTPGAMVIPGIQR